MISVPQRFAGFRSASSVLTDKGLSWAEKRAALLSWREALHRQPASAFRQNTALGQTLREIDQALERLDEDTGSQDRQKKARRRRSNAGG